MEVIIDIERLRGDLLDYFGSALFSTSSLAFIELQKVEEASEEELIDSDLKNGFNLRKYIIEYNESYNCKRVK